MGGRLGGKPVNLEADLRGGSDAAASAFQGFRQALFFVATIIIKKGFYAFQVIDQKDNDQHCDGDTTPFFQDVNMNVLVDEVDDIVSEKGIDHNRSKGSAEND